MDESECVFSTHLCTNILLIMEHFAWKLCSCKGNFCLWRHCLKNIWKKLCNNNFELPFLLSEFVERESLNLTRNQQWRTVRWRGAQEMPSLLLTRWKGRKMCKTSLGTPDPGHVPYYANHLSFKRLLHEHSLKLQCCEWSKNYLGIKEFQRRSRHSLILALDPIRTPNIAASLSTLALQ